MARIQGGQANTIHWIPFTGYHSLADHSLNSPLQLAGHSMDRSDWRAFINKKKFAVKSWLQIIEEDVIKNSEFLLREWRADFALHCVLREKNFFTVTGITPVWEWWPVLRVRALQMPGKREHCRAKSFRSFEHGCLSGLGCYPAIIRR